MVIAELRYNGLCCCFMKYFFIDNLACVKNFDTDNFSRGVIIKNDVFVQFFCFFALAFLGGVFEIDVGGIRVVVVFEFHSFT